MKKVEILNLSMKDLAKEMAKRQRMVEAIDRRIARQHHLIKQLEAAKVQILTGEVVKVEEMDKKTGNGSWAAMTKIGDELAKKLQPKKPFTLAELVAKLDKPVAIPALRMSVSRDPRFKKVDTGIYILDDTPEHKMVKKGEPGPVAMAFSHFPENWKGTIDQAVGMVATLGYKVPREKILKGLSNHFKRVGEGTYQKK